MKITRELGTLLLAIFLVAYGLTGLGVSLGILPAVAALLAGIVLLIRR